MHGMRHIEITQPTQNILPYPKFPFQPKAPIPTPKRDYGTILLQHISPKVRHKLLTFEVHNKPRTTPTFSVQFSPHPTGFKFMDRVDKIDVHVDTFTHTLYAIESCLDERSLRIIFMPLTDQLTFPWNPGNSPWWKTPEKDCVDYDQGISSGVRCRQHACLVAQLVMALHLPHRPTSSV